MSSLIFEFSCVRGRLFVKISVYMKFLRNGGQMSSLIPNPKSVLWRAKLQAPFSRTGIYFLVGSASFKVTNFTCALSNNHTTLTTLFLSRWLDLPLPFCFTRSFSLYGQKTLVFLQEQSVQLATSKLPSSETQGQIVGSRESLDGRKNKARRKVKKGEKSPWGQCLTRPVPNGRRRSGF